MKKFATISMFAVAPVLPAYAWAADEAKDVGVRTGVVSASGEPANDILVSGLLGRFPIGDNTYIGVGLDLASYDFEEPAKLPGLKQSGAKAIDADASSTILQAWYEKRYDTSGGKWQLLWVFVNDLDIEISISIHQYGTFVAAIQSLTPVIRPI